MSTALSLTLLLIGALAPRTSVAQADRRLREIDVRGHVVDAAGTQALADAHISIADGAQILATALSDSLGNFQLKVPGRAVFSISVRRLGYDSATGRVPAESLAVPLIVRLSAAPHALERIEVVTSGWVSSRLAGFEARARRDGGGSYITRDDIEKWHPSRVTNLMRRVNGVRLWDSSGTVLVVSGRGEKVDLRKGMLMGNCVMRVAVDGAMKEWGFPIDLIPPEDIHGIEIYRGPATIPSEFSGMRPDSYCGLIMIWTRSGQ